MHDEDIIKMVIEYIKENHDSIGEFLNVKIRNCDFYLQKQVILTLFATINTKLENDPYWTTIPAEKIEKMAYKILNRLFALEQEEIRKKQLQFKLTKEYENIEPIETTPIGTIEIPFKREEKKENLDEMITLDDINDVIITLHTFLEDSVKGKTCYNVPHLKKMLNFWNLFKKRYVKQRYGNDLNLKKEKEK